MKSILQKYNGSYQEYLKEFKRLEGNTSCLEISLTLGKVFFRNLKKYGTTIESIAEQTHQDVHQNFPPILVDNLCFYTSSYFADACQYFGVGDVSIVKGKHSLFCPEKLDRTWKKDLKTGLYEKTWLHHWNFDRDSNRFIDIKGKKLVICDRKDQQFNEDYSYRQEDMDCTSEQILGFPLLETAKTH
jgi:hypothetical protein